MSYGSLHDHRQMLFDDRRNELYANALSRTVKPGDVVMDLGAGLGIHGYIAATCGASRVYLVEPARVLNTTKSLFDTTPYSDRFVYQQARIEELVATEPVDVIVSVLTGNFVVMEDLLPSLFHARDKWLKPGGKLIPNSAEMIVAAVSLPKFYDSVINCWNNTVHQLDVHKLRQQAINSVYTTTAQDSNPELLSPPGTLKKINLMTASDVNCDDTVTVEIDSNGVCHGVLGWFDAELAGETLSTSPLAPPLHWLQAFLPLPEPVEVNAGDKLTFSLKRPDFGEWTWHISLNGLDYRQSTFLGQIQSPADLARRSLKFQPATNRRGEALKFLLDSMDGAVDSEQLITLMNANFPDIFITDNAAHDFTMTVIERYG